MLANAPAPSISGNPPGVFRCPAEKGPNAGSPTLYSRAASSMGRTRWPRCSWLSRQIRQMSSPWSSQKSSCACFMWRLHCGRLLGFRLAICRPSCHSRLPWLFPGSKSWHRGQLDERLSEASGSLEAAEQLQEMCTQLPPTGSPCWARQRGHTALSCSLPEDTAMEKAPEWQTQDATRGRCKSAWRESVPGMWIFSVRLRNFPGLSSPNFPPARTLGLRAKAWISCQSWNLEFSGIYPKERHFAINSMPSSCTCTDTGGIKMGRHSTGVGFTTYHHWEGA